MSERFEGQGGDAQASSIPGLEVVDLGGDVETVTFIDAQDGEVIRFPEERTTPSLAGLEVTEIFLEDTEMDRNRLEELAGMPNASISTRVHAVANAILVASNDESFVAPN